MSHSVSLRQPAARRGFVITLQLALVGGFVAVVETTAGWSQVFAVVRSVEPLAWACMLGLSVAVHALRAHRLRLARGIPPTTPASALFAVATHHNLLNVLLPLRIGELALPTLLRRRFDVTWGNGTAFLALARLTDLYVVGAVAVGIATVVEPTAGAALVAWVGLPVVARPVLRAWTRRDRPRLLSDTAEYLCAVDPRALLATTVSLWVLKLTALGLLLRAATGLDGLAATAGAVGGELSGVLPVNAVAGIGTYEVGVVAGSRLTGAPLEGLVEGAIALHVGVLLSAGVSALAGSTVQRLATCPSTPLEPGR